MIVSSENSEGQEALLLALLILIDVISFKTFYYATNCQNIYPDHSILSYTQNPLRQEVFYLYTESPPVQSPLVVMLFLYKPSEMLTDTLKYLDNQRILTPSGRLYFLTFLL